MGNSGRRGTKTAIRKAVEKYFEIDGVKHKPFNNRGVARATYAVNAHFRHVDMVFHVHRDRLVLRSIIPINANEEERAKVGEFLLRANYGLNTGGFDFDCDDGEISYRISIYCGEEEFAPPTYEQIDFALILSLSMIDRYGDALVKVMNGLVEPVDAVEAAEDDD